jgi:hypothetical protein
MTRREQLIINDYCEREILMLNAELGKILSVRRLHKCQAYVYETTSYYLLKSYATFVAFIRKSDCECFDILRNVYGYSATSAQHIAKFKKDYHADSIQTWREV